MRTTEELQKDADKAKRLIKAIVKFAVRYEWDSPLFARDIRALAPLIAELFAKLREEGYNYMGAMADNDHLVETIRNATDLDKLKALTELNYPSPPNKEQDDAYR